MQPGALWAEVCDANWRRVGDGPVTLLSASITRALDGAGAVSIQASASDTRALELLTNEARVRIYTLNFDGSSRELGRGILRNIQRSDSQAGYMLSADGPDALDALKRFISFDVYDNIALPTVASNLVSRAAWLAIVPDALAFMPVSVRMDGASVLSVLQTIAEQNGLHLRLALAVGDAAVNTVEIGSFGDDIGLILTNNILPPAYGPSSDEVASITSLSLTQVSEAVANRIYPFGAGEGEAALTLSNSTRAGIMSLTMADGRTLYYLEDSASIASYGVIERAITFKNIGPLENADSSKIVASNALYDAAAAWLDRNADKQVVYAVTVAGCKRTIRAGDRVKISYRGVIRDESDGSEIQDANIEDSFYVLKATESAGDGGSTLDLEISNVDQMVQDEAAMVVNAMDSVRLSSLRPGTYPFFSENTYTDVVDSGDPNESLHIKKNATFKIELDNSVTDITRVVIRWKTKPLVTYSMPRPTLFDDGGILKVLSWYAVITDNQYPSDVSMWVNNVDVSAQYGGPWNVGDVNAPLDVRADITDLILTAGLYRENVIEVRSAVPTNNRPVYVPVPNLGGGTVNRVSHGFVEMNIRIQGTAQATKPPV